MFPINAAFIMTLLAVTYSRSPVREWSSLTIAVFGLGLMGVAVEGDVSLLLSRQMPNVFSCAGLVLFACLCGYCAREWSRDMRGLPPTVFPGMEAVYVQATSAVLASAPPV